jgi:hypothetical protein
MFVQLVYKLPTFRVTQRVHYRCFKTARHWRLSCLVAFNLRRYVILFSYQFQYYSPILVKITCSSAFPTNIHGFLIPPVFATCPTHFILFDWLYYYWRVQIMKLLTMRFSPFSSPSSPNTSHQSVGDEQSFTHTKQVTL